ncbi:MAG: Gfo/Idh/MocA family oxidoreductase [Steroidobacteraceae bacterium]
MTIRMGIAGLGKMGLSHLAIVRAHPQVRLVAACDNTAYVTDVLTKYAALECYSDFDRMLAVAQLDAVLIATPSKLHATMVGKALERGLHVFCEKPFVLDVKEGERLTQLAEGSGLVTQVGYHCRFVGAFQEAARIVKSGALGTIHHVRAEAYGPVVLRRKGSTWRSTRNEGGGALYDYACHAIDLVNFIAGQPVSVGGVVRNAVYSSDVDDEIYCSLYLDGGASGQLCVNWSDESFRKMSTRITVWGTNGRIAADRQECQIFLRDPHVDTPELKPGWTVRYTTDLTKEVWFYLRGEEYSAQIDYFARSIEAGRTKGENSFRSALEADRVVAMILAAGTHPTESGPSPTAGTARRGFWARIFG